MASIKALLLRYNHTTTWKHHTLVTKNSAERATQAASLQSRLAKLLWHHRLLLVSVLAINTKTALRLYFNYFPFANPKLARGSKNLYNPAIDPSRGQVKRRRQIQFRLRFWAAPFARAARWAKVVSTSVLLKTSTGLGSKLHTLPSSLRDFRAAPGLRALEGSRLVLFGTAPGRHRQLVKVKKADTVDDSLPSKAADPLNHYSRHPRIWVLPPQVPFSIATGAGCADESTTKRPQVQLSVASTQKQVGSAQGQHTRPTDQARPGCPPTPLHEGELHPRSHSKVVAKTAGKKPRRRGRPRPKKKPMTIKEQLGYQRSLDYIKLMAIEAQAAVAEIEREEAEEKAAAERKRKIESGEISPFTPPAPNKFDLARDHFFGPKKSKGRDLPPTPKASGEERSPIQNKATGTAVPPLGGKVDETQCLDDQPEVMANRVGLAAPWRPTTPRQSPSVIRERYVFLHVGRVLSGLLGQRVSLAGRSALSLSVGETFTEYKRQVISSLPHQYVTRLFFINDLVSAIIATTLLRSSNILSFYLARLLERLPRHTWFFHIFNRVMSVFKFYCRAPISLKVLIKGRVNKKLRKQTVCVLRTQVALSTLDCAVDYSLTHSFTSASVLGIKVWVVSNSRAAKTKTFSQRYKTY